MTAEERIALINLKIERADQHIGCLKSTIKSFVNSDPYKVGTKRDPETRKLIYYVESVQPVPVIVATIAGDALHCLRDALDHLAQQLYLVGSGTRTGIGTRQAFRLLRAPKNSKPDLPER